MLGTALVAACCLMLLTSVALVVAYPNVPPISELTDYRPQLPLRVYSADGVLLGEYGEERRRYLPLDEIPPRVVDAVLSVEDARFYQHPGIDIVRVLGAGLRNIVDFRSEGASTITMQLARNFYLPTEKTFTRKVYEMLLALKIESQLSKQQILETYMNHIDLGQRAHGFAAASEIYFGKPLKDVTLAEAAMLAGLPQAPSTHNPAVNPQRAKQRQLHVLDRMWKTGVITQAERDDARIAPLQYRVRLEAPAYARHVAETARQLVYAQYGADAYTRGLNVWLSIDSGRQMAAYRALRRGILDYERRQPYRGPEAYVDLPADPAETDARVAEALLKHPDNDELRAAVVLEAQPDKVVAALADGQVVSVTGSGLQPAAAALRGAGAGASKTAIRRGAVVRLVQGAAGWTLTQLPEVEGAVVSLDPRSGAILALVGGFDHAKNQFNHATQAWRQPGSAFKPFVYSAALEKGYTPATVILDGPLFFSASAGAPAWEPKNYDQQFEGPMSLRRSLAKSKNIPAVRLLQAIGTPYARSWVGRFGFEAERHPASLTMALGAGTTTPLQLASAYAVFANGGYRLPPVLITRLTDARGRVLKEIGPAAMDTTTRAIDPRNAFLTGSLLQEVTRSGTAARAQQVLKRPDLYGKTGTTNDSFDAWFAGYQPGLVAVVWLGYDEPRRLGEREGGATLALPVWIDYMGQALQGAPVVNPETPDGLVWWNGEWYYEEYTPTTGISTLGMEDLPPPPPSEEEKRGILDLFRS
ncbi:penicillin-binding protein [Caldimonas brevitalea]|uniref:Penicillin-binding protein 1A n=1 Tax=Caldimonas brevitalea TaxID=413882 RepID=A0A0G3BQE8_9BURK|nr:penicillin-binding protein [Caldimonas brevitalea]